MESQIDLFVEQKKKIHNDVLNYIESIDEYESYEYFQIINDHINRLNDDANKKEIQELVILISKISKNHHYDNVFFQKITMLILQLSDFIKIYFTNFEIFNIFKRSKRIILFLLKNQIITIDQAILDFIYPSKRNLKDKLFYYDIFLYPEINEFLNDETKIIIEYRKLKLGLNNFEQFDIKRECGENDNYLYELIRNDSVEKFIEYINRHSISLNSVINPSAFETNLLLIKNKVTIIEYAAFYGAIQIVQYLKYSNVDLNSSLWIYAIHSNNADMIHFLEENEVDPPKFSYTYCLKEAIKCHHNNIAHYIFDNLMRNNEIIDIKRDYFENIILYSLHYLNYEFFVDDAENNNVFLYLCQYNQIELVKLFMKCKSIDVNFMIVYFNLFNNITIYIYIKFIYYIF